MELVEAIEKRRSIRGYKQTPVPREVLAEILNLAHLAPSGVNLQPWEFIVLTGNSLEKAKKFNEEQVNSGAEVSADVPGYHYSLAGVYRERQVALGKKIFQIMDINRDDKERRTEWVVRGMRFYDAPAVVLVCLDEMIFSTQSPMTLVDIGIVTQNIVSLALQYGLGTCIQAAPVQYASALKKTLDIPEAKRLVLAVAVGYPDDDFPANRLKTERASLDELVTWKD